MKLRVVNAWAMIPRIALGMFVLSGILVLLVVLAAYFPRLDEAGYPDSYMLYDALHFQRTGVIYRDPQMPPFPSGIYSPILYVFLSIPGRIVETANPFVGPRLLMLLAFIGCVACVGSITRAIIPLRSAHVWSMLLAASIGSMPRWVLQLRTDFPGVAFSLLSVRLVLARGKWMPFLAGAAAGMAFQFKITFVSAAFAGALWLLVAKRWRDFAAFTGAGAVVGFGLYVYFQLREPLTIERILSMNLTIRDYAGLVRLVHQTIVEPVFILSIAALPLVIRKVRSGWSLLIYFASASLAVATITAAHAGANSNYFFEVLFALTPLAALGAVKLVNTQSRWATGSVMAALMLTGYGTLPNLHSARTVALSGLGSDDRAAERKRFEMLGTALPGHRILSTIPRISLLLDSPVIIEPFFLSYSQRMGRFDSAPIRAQIRGQEFEAVVTGLFPRSYRGVPSVPEDIIAEIAKSYVPFCLPGGDILVRLPRGQPEPNTLGLQLKQLGCKPLDDNPIAGG